MRIGLTRVASVLKIKLAVDFIFQTDGINSHIYTIPEDRFKKLFPQEKFNLDDLLPESAKNTLPGGTEEIAPLGYLIIDSTYELEEYDSIGEGSAFIRPQLLVLHGLLTFFTKTSFTPFQNEAILGYQIPKHMDFGRNKSLLVLDGKSYSNPLKRVLNGINTANKSKQVLIFTLLERWRKAFYLESESEDSLVHLDEAVLAYFHILEVLSNEYSKTLKRRVDKEKSDLYDELLKNINSLATDDKKKSALKKLNNLILEKKVNVKEKIACMLEDLGLFNLKSKNIVDRFTDHRNDIAHGRKNIYHDKAIYPLLPFFSLIQDIDERVETIRFFSASVISSYLGIEIWKKEWNNLMKYEPVPYELVKEFVIKEEYKNLTVDQIVRGAINDITPQVLAYYYYRNEKEITIAKLEEILTEVVLAKKINKGNSFQFFDISLILADSRKVKLAEKSRNNVVQIYKNDWGYFSNIRNVLKSYEYVGKKLPWFKSWLIDGKPTNKITGIKKAL